jgi:hypothetical protein
MIHCDITIAAYANEKSPALLICNERACPFILSMNI